MEEGIYRAVVERNPVGVLVYDPDTRGILYANPALEGMLLYGAGELRETQLYDLFALDRRDTDARTGRALEAGQCPPDEVRLRRKNGSLVRAEVRLVAIPHVGRGAVCALVRDVEDEVRGKPRGTAAFARSAIDSLSAHVAILDGTGTIVATNRPWRRFAEANGAVPAEVSEGVNYLEVCDAAAGRNCADAAAFARGMRSVLSGREEAFEREYPCHSPTERRWFVGRVTRFADTEPPWAVVAHENVTGRKKAENALQDQNVLLKTTLSQAAEAIVVCDLQGRFTFANDAARRMAMTEPEGSTLDAVSEVAGVPHYPDGTRMPVEQSAMRRALRGETTVGMEVRMVRPDGSHYDLLASAGPLENSDGTIVGAVASFRDITEQKAMEEERERSRGREIATRTQREERRRISRDLHDMVLQDLSGALQSLRLAHLHARGAGSPLDLEEELGALRRATAGLRGAIYDLRHEEERTFVRSVESLVELNRQATPGRRISLGVEEGFPEELPGEVGVELLRILQEALANARRHSGAENVRVRLLAEGGEALAELTDDGRGFEPGEVREGVGLSAMRERVERLGGGIEVVSRPGEGTRVTVRVPLGGGTPDPRPL
ncbi:PAS domain-containing sensor histidine kinase [Rubrobacter tropicus]|uniref:PAS domain-containing sensor histidine kinase n=1 Tax=Rubrobacter tropicus TaxID=2653851 RepID=UPI00140924EB|nr:PAS domain S-box protein [Rubrobacter tropicus]